MNDHEWRIQRKSTWEATNKIKDSAPFSTAKPHLAAAKSAKTQIEVIDIDDIEYTFCYNNGSKCWYPVWQEIAGKWMFLSPNLLSYIQTNQGTSTVMKCSDKVPNMRCLSNLSEQVARLWCAWTTLVGDTGSNSSCRHREDNKTQCGTSVLWQWKSKQEKIRLFCFNHMKPIHFLKKIMDFAEESQSRAFLRRK